MAETDTGPWAPTIVQSQLPDKMRRICGEAQRREAWQSTAGAWAGGAPSYVRYNDEDPPGPAGVHAEACRQVAMEPGGEEAQTRHSAHWQQAQAFQGAPPRQHKRRHTQRHIGTRTGHTYSAWRGSPHPWGIYADLQSTETHTSAIATQTSSGTQPATTCANSLPQRSPYPDKHVHNPSTRQIAEHTPDPP